MPFGQLAQNRGRHPQRRKEEVRKDHFRTTGPSPFFKVSSGGSSGPLSEDLADVNSHPSPSLRQPYGNILTRITCGGGPATPIRQIRRKQTEKTGVWS